MLEKNTVEADNISRSADTGVSFESIHRSGDDDFLDYGEDDFLESHMQHLFDQLEQSSKRQEDNDRCSTIRHVQSCD
jgi:hypothetical protein